MYLGLGYSYSLLGRLDEALKAYLYMRHLDPTNPEAYAKLGTLYVARNELESAAVAFYQALCLDASRQELWPPLRQCFQKFNEEPAPAVKYMTLAGKNVYFRGSGGLFSTAEDYVPLGMMLANGGELNGKRLLSRKTVEMMSAAHVPDTLPGRPAGEGYGLSVRVVTNHAARGTMLSDGTYGWTGAQGTHFFVDPKEQLVGVLMVQTPIQEMQREFEDLVAQSVND